MRNIRQNLFFAFIYNALGVPIAAGVLYPFFGLLLSPMIAARGDELQLGLGHRQRAAAAAVAAVRRKSAEIVQGLRLELNRPGQAFSPPPPG